MYGVIVNLPCEWLIRPFFDQSVCKTSALPRYSCYSYLGMLLLGIRRYVSSFHVFLYPLYSSTHRYHLAWGVTFSEMIRMTGLETPCYLCESVNKCWCVKSSWVRCYCECKARVLLNISMYILLCAARSCEQTGMSYRFFFHGIIALYIRIWVKTVCRLPAPDVCFTLSTLQTSLHSFVLTYKEKKVKWALATCTWLHI